MEWVCQPWVAQVLCSTRAAQRFQVSRLMFVQNPHALCVSVCRASCLVVPRGSVGCMLGGTKGPQQLLPLIPQNPQSYTLRHTLTYLQTMASAAPTTTTAAAAAAPAASASGGGAVDLPVNAKAVKAAADAAGQKGLMNKVFSSVPIASLPRPKAGAVVVIPSGRWMDLGRLVRVAAAVSSQHPCSHPQMQPSRRQWPS